MHVYRSTVSCDISVLSLSSAFSLGQTDGMRSSLLQFFHSIYGAQRPFYVLFFSFRYLGISGVLSYHFAVRDASLYCEHG